MSVKRFLSGRSLGLVVALALVAVASGCGEVDEPASPRASDNPSTSQDESAGQQPTRAGVAVDEASLLPAGTALFGDVMVQDGSELVGSVFPQPDRSLASPQPMIAWQAVLLVTGDPYAVWDSYVDALQLGDEARVRGACTVTRVAIPEPRPQPTDTMLVESEEPPPERFVTEPPVDGENRLQCSVAVDGSSMDLVVGASLRCLDAEPSGLRDSECETAPTAHLFIRSSIVPIDSDYDSYGTDNLRNSRAFEDSPSEAVDPVPVPTGPLVSLESTAVSGESELPASGDRFDDSLDYYLSDGEDDDIAKMPDGGRSLVTPSLLIPCNSGLVAVLGLPGLPSAALDAFDQAAADDDPMVRSAGTDASGREWEAGLISTAGGYYLDLVAVADGSDSIVLVTECGD